MSFLFLFESIVAVSVIFDAIFWKKTINLFLILTSQNQAFSKKSSFSVGYEQMIFQLMQNECLCPKDIIYAKKSKKK